MDAHAQPPIDPLAADHIAAPVDPLHAERATAPVDPLHVERAPGPVDPLRAERATGVVDPSRVDGQIATVATQGRRLAAQLASGQHPRSYRLSVDVAEDVGEDVHSRLSAFTPELSDYDRLYSPETPLTSPYSDPLVRTMLPVYGGLGSDRRS